MLFPPIKHLYLFHILKLFFFSFLLQKKIEIDEINKKSLLRGNFLIIYSFHSELERLFFGNKYIFTDYMFDIG